MKKCIICRIDKADDEFNEEHVIPDSLGNKQLKIYDVCKECNGNLGNRVDCGIINNILMDMIRFRYKLSGKKGKVPNPFARGIDKDNNRIIVDDNMKPRFDTNVRVDGDKVSIITSSDEDAKGVLEKILKRKGIQKTADEVIAQGEHVSSAYQPTISYEGKVDLQKIEDAHIKIAYEYAYMKLKDEGYLEDELGKKISKYLYNLTKGIISDCPTNVFDIPKQVFEDTFKEKILNKNHFITMGKIGENNLGVSIILFGDMVFSATVIVSDTIQRYKYINHVELIKIEN